MGLKVSYYTNLILSTGRAYNKGVPSNAKPLLFIAIIDGISCGDIMGNKLHFEETLLSLYTSTCKKLEPWREAAKFYKPFFHMKSEPYYFIKWKDGVKYMNASHTPSAKFLRENVEYACLDDELWELLQDPETRNELREAIIQHFIKPRT